MSKRKHMVYLKLAVYSVVLAVGAPLAQAGDLNPPPGPVGPTGRFGPRTEISDTKTPGDADSLFKITQPGSYYLAGNITGESGKSGIEVAASNVTLDLNGFALIGAPGSLSGVSVPVAQVGVAIRNGTIRDWGANGVSAGSVKYGMLENLRANNNGGTGLQLGDGGVVTTCIAGENSGDGIAVGRGASVSNCTSYDNTGKGIFGTLGTKISGCSAYSNSGLGIWSGQGSLVAKCAAYANGAGIQVDILSTVTNCTASQNSNDGIRAGDGSTVSNCTASDNSDDGIRVDSGCLVLGCTANDNTGSGIFTDSSTGRIEGNNVIPPFAGFGPVGQAGKGRCADLRMVCILRIVCNPGNAHPKGLASRCHKRQGKNPQGKRFPGLRPRQGDGHASQAQPDRQYNGGRLQEVQGHTDS